MKKITLLLAFLVSSIGFAQDPTTAPTAPTNAQADVLSIFSDTYTNVAVSDRQAFGDAVVTEIDISGNTIIKATTPVSGAGFQYQFFGVPQPDLTSYTTAHIDFYIDGAGGTIADGTVFQLIVQQDDGGGVITNILEEFNISTNGGLATDTWHEMDVDFTDFNINSGNARNKIQQVILQVAGGGGAAAGPFYVDNLYFSRPPTTADADATLSDLAVGGTTVDGFSSSTFTYNVELPNGTTTAPTVTATATQAGNGSSAVSITQASGVPGTATIDVTAPNGTDTEQYTINFTEAPLAPTTAAPNVTVTSGGALVMYSDAPPVSSSEVSVSNFNLVAFNGAGTYSEVDIESNGNNAILMNNLSFYGAGWDTENVSTYTHVHFHYFVSSSTGFNFFLIDGNAGIPGGNPAEPRYSIAPSGGDETLVTGEWVSVTIPLTHFLNFNTGSFTWDLDDIIQWKFDGNGVIYIDNVFFSNSATLSTNGNELFKTSVFPNPTNTQWTISTPNNTIKTVEVFNLLGKKVVSQKVDDNIASVPVTSLASGIYLARVTTEVGTKTIKLIRE